VDSEALILDLFLVGHPVVWIISSLAAVLVAELDHNIVVAVAAVAVPPSVFGQLFIRHLFKTILELKSAAQGVLEDFPAGVAKPQCLLHLMLVLVAEPHRMVLILQFHFHHLPKLHLV
jgi:hypothetical protein